MKLLVCKISVMILALALCLFFASCGGVADGSKDSEGVDFNSTDSSFTAELPVSSTDTDNGENSDTESSKNTVQSNESTNSSENTVQSNESSVNSNESSNLSDTGSSVPDIEKPGFFVATVQKASGIIAQPYTGNAEFTRSDVGIGPCGWVFQRAEKAPGHLPRRLLFIRNISQIQEKPGSHRKGPWPWLPE
jgi:hypothetical protein